MMKSIFSSDSRRYSLAASVPGMFDRKVSVAGYVINGVAWANLDVALDITLRAKVGDVVEVGISTLWQSAGVVWGALDVASIVAGVPVNTWGRDGPEIATGTGVAAWEGPTSEWQPIGPPVSRRLVAGDIANEQVLLRLRRRTFTAADKWMSVSVDRPFIFWARNHG